MRGRRMNRTRRRKGSRVRRRRKGRRRMKSNEEGVREKEKKIVKNVKQSEK